ncbi:ABC transporter ATP-binding protein [Desulfococcaceae bacterium HSG7]|nr:ABC transporter ATP-binding protein [Desulfococcaceae bacterium HSG7]
MAVLEIKNVTKSFGSLIANEDISLSLKKGEVLALLGENGAGKTTLMNVLFGHYTADSGRIMINGKKLVPGSTEAAINAGIGMVHQHFTLADNMTVLENIILGTEKLFALRTNTLHAKNKLEKLSQRFGLEVNPDDRIADISVGVRQRVEILKVLYRNAKILVLDEPTAVLTPQEVEQLFKILELMLAQGLSIIFISHKLHEILRISHRVMILRRGKIVGEVETKDADRDILAHMMVGRQVDRPVVSHLKPGRIVMELRELSAGEIKADNPELNNIHLQVHEHEIIGLAGVSGNGQSILAQVLSGIQAPSKGNMYFMGEDVSKKTPRQLVRMGIGRIPEDRHEEGIIGDMELWENCILEDLREPPFWRGGWLLNEKDCRDYSDKLIHAHDVRCKNMDMPAKLLSGGNIQKLILARVLSHNPKFILANQPVRGLDEGAIAAVHENLFAAKQNGAAILLISEDLDEIFSISDRIVVMYHGKLSIPIDVDKASSGDIGAIMAGDMNRAITLQG